MRKNHFLFLIICLLPTPWYTAATENDSAVYGVELIIWEQQSWRPNGGYKRLTLWRDGRSQVEVMPFQIIPSGPSNMLPKKGWTVVRQGRQISFVRKDIYPPEVVRVKLKQAIEAGIQLLETFRPGYADGSGTRVVVQVNGKQKETLVPGFDEDMKGTASYKRYVAVSKILSGFDTDAFELTVE